jgi:hypothetical protein
MILPGHGGRALIRIKVALEFATARAVGPRPAWVTLQPAAVDR